MKIQQLVLEFTSRFDGRGISQLIDNMRNVRYETEGVMHTMNRLGAVFTAVTGAAASSFQRYEFSLTEFAGKAMKTTEEFGALFGKVSGNIARSSGLARAEVLRGLQEGTSAQLNAQLSADLTRKAAILGAGRQSLMRQTVNVALSGYRNAFGDPGKVLDYVYAAAQLGQGQVPEFAPAAQYVFPFARGAGIGLSEVAAGLSAISTTAPSPLMGSTQFGAFLTGVARGSTFEQMLIDKTGGKTSQGIRDMLREEGLARTAEFLASKFSGDELQQVYGRKELVQFVQGVTGQPGLLARLERMINANAESKPIERFGKDLENTMQNQFDRLVQTMQQLGADFGKPVGELAKLLLRFTRGAMEALISINESLGGALSYLFTYGGGVALINRLPFVGSLFKAAAGGAARKWTDYASVAGLDQSGPLMQMLVNFGIETAAGGAVMGGYGYFDSKIKNAKDKSEKAFAKKAKKAYRDYLASDYSEAEARRMADEVYTGDRSWRPDKEEAEGKSVGASYAGIKKDAEHQQSMHVEGYERNRDEKGNVFRGTISVFSDHVGETLEEKRWLKNQEKREKSGKRVRMKSQFPPWSLWKQWSNEKKHSFLASTEGGMNMGRFIYDQLATGDWAENFLKSEGVWRNHPDFYAGILRSQNDGKRRRVEHDAENKFLEAFEAGEIEFKNEKSEELFSNWFKYRAKMYYPTDQYLRETADIWNEKGADEFEEFIMKHVRTYGTTGYSLEKGGMPLRKIDMKNYVKDLTFVTEHPYMDEEVKKRARKLMDVIEHASEKDSWEEYATIMGRKDVFNKSNEEVAEGLKKKMQEVEDLREEVREQSRSKFYGKDKKTEASPDKAQTPERPVDNEQETWKKYRKNVDALLADSERLGQSVDLKNSSEWGDIEKRIALLRELGENKHFKPGQRTKFSQTARVLEMFLESGEYSDPFKAEKERRAQELEAEKAFEAKVEAEYAEAERIRKETEEKAAAARKKADLEKEAEQKKAAAEKVAEQEKAAEEKAEKQKKAAARKAAPPPPPPPPPRGSQGAFDFGPPGGGGGGSDGGPPPRAIYDPATGQYFFDYGNGDAWRKMSQGQFEFPPYSPYERDSMFRQSRFGGDGFFPSYTQPFYPDDKRSIVDPATRQIMMDFGTGHRWGKTPQQMELGLTGGVLGSIASQLAFDTLGFGTGALLADYLGGKVRGWWGDHPNRKTIPNAGLHEGPDVSAERRRAEQWTEENVDGPRRRAEFEERERQERLEAERKARVRSENLRKAKAHSARMQRERETREERRQEKNDFWRERMSAQEKMRSRWSSENITDAYENTVQWRRDQVHRNAAGSQTATGIKTPSFIDMLTFGASGWIGDVFGEGVSKFSGSRFGSSFIDGKSRMGIKEFFGQAKSKDMPKDISKMAYFMGRMYGLAVSPVGLGVGAATLGWWGINKAIDSTDWGKDQIYLRDQRDLSIYNPDRVRDWQKQNLDWAQQIYDENQLPSGRQNMGPYSKLADWWDSPFSNTWKWIWNRQEDIDDEITAKRLYRNRGRMTPEKRAELMEHLEAAGWEEVIAERTYSMMGETKTTQEGYIRRREGHSKKYNMKAIMVPESLAKEYGWMEAKDIFGEFLVDGDPNLEAIQRLAQPDLLGGASAESIQQWRNQNLAFPELGGEFPVTVIINDNSQVTFNGEMENEQRLLEILDEKNQTTSDDVVRRVMRHFGRPVE